MSGVSENVESTICRDISSKVGLPEHSRGPSRAAQGGYDQPASRPIKVSILMCSFNEEEGIEGAINDVLSATYPCDIELIVVGDDSADSTTLIAEKIDDPRLVVYRLPSDSGKGYALCCAADLATGTHIVPFDAGLEYSAADIPRLIEPVIKRDYDVVYGARIFGRNTVYQSYRHAMGNRILTRISNILFDTHLSDMHTCLKLVSLPLFRQLVLNESRLSLDIELTAILLRLGVRPFEVPVSYHSRSRAEGKIISWRDGVDCVAILLKVRLRRRNRLRAAEGVSADRVAEHKACLEPCTMHSTASAEAPLAQMPG